MSTDSKQSAVSSMSSILKSIDNDRQVYRWFLMLISLVAVQEKLSAHIKIKDDYQSLKQIRMSEIFFYLVMALIVITALLTKQPLILLTVIVPIAVLLNLFRKNRSCVAAISGQFLLENIQPDDLTRQSLFQTCEYISTLYHIPSLVDIITFQDFIARKVLLGTILILPFIYSFKTWQLLAVTLMIFLTTLAIVNTSIILRKLK